MGKRPGSADSPQACKKQATSPSHAAGTDSVPVTKPSETVQGTSPSPAAGIESNLSRPVVPTEKDDKTNCNMEMLMKEMCRWCEQELPAAASKFPGLAEMFKKRSFWECNPLAIEESEKGSRVGHKEPFDQNKCSVGIAQTGMYEASMNIDWLSVFPLATTSRQIMGDVPTLAEVQAGAESWFNYSQDP